jgi:hypothetical protein
MRGACVFVLICAPAAFADRVYLKGGGVLTGVVVERNDRRVVLEVGPGRIGLPSSRVERIETGASAVAEYRARAASLAPGDAHGWVELALWARSQGLETQARVALDRALLADPQNADAHRALGHVLLGGAWLTAEEGYRAKGLVAFEGAWVTPAEREVAVRDRVASAAAEAARREAEARAREAEARARAAEAEARRAEAASAGPGSVTTGIPYWWVVAGSACHGPRCIDQRPPRPRPQPSHTPGPAPLPAPRVEGRTRPRSETP